MKYCSLLHGRVCVMRQRTNNLLSATYVNMSMQYTSIFFFRCKDDNFRMMIFLFLLKNYIVRTLELPKRAGTNEYPPSMFYERKKEKKYVSVNHCFAI